MQSNILGGSKIPPGVGLMAYQRRLAQSIDDEAKAKAERKTKIVTESFDLTKPLIPFDSAEREILEKAASEGDAAARAALLESDLKG